VWVVAQEREPRTASLPKPGGLGFGMTIVVFIFADGFGKLCVQG
jgi:hypothetical protein